MKRIEKILSASIDDLKKTLRIKQINNSIEKCRLNAQTAKDNAELKIEQIIMGFNNMDNDVNHLIKEINDQYNIIEDSEKTLNRINKIKSYFNEDIE